MSMVLVNGLNGQDGRRLVLTCTTRSLNNGGRECVWTVHTATDSQSKCTFVHHRGLVSIHRSESMLAQINN